MVYENLGFRSTQMYQLCKGLSNDYSCIVLILSGFLVSDIVYENLGFRSTQMYQLCKGLSNDYSCTVLILSGFLASDFFLNFQCLESVILQSEVKFTDCFF